MFEILRFEALKKLELHHAKQKLKDEIDEKAAEWQRNRDDLKAYDDEMNKLNREIQNIETELNKCKELYDRHSQMFANKTEEYRLYLKVITIIDSFYQKLLIYYWASTYTEIFYL